jgi:LacI family transcriptional regulator, galactose operon repressor
MQIDFEAEFDATMAGNSRTTIAEVAELAGVSRTTVSHVLSGNRPVAATTRERVERTIDELRFRPNGLARSLRTQRTDTIALIIPDITNPFYPVLARGLDDAMSGRYRTYICNTDAVRARELEFVADVSDRHVDGMVIVPFQIAGPDLLHILDDRMPVVTLGGRVDDPRVDVVLTDDEHGAFEATRHLILRGGGRIGMIRGAEGTDLQRFTGYRRALDSMGIPLKPELTAIGEWTRPGGFRAMHTLLALPDPPTAVFSANDLMAIGAMDAAREVGLSIPGDLALVGYDDIEAAALVSPPLTTVVNPAYEVGRAAGRLLADRMTGGYTGERREVVLHCRLVDRGST